MNWLKRFFDRPQPLRSRKLLVKIHLWTGIIIGLYVVIISVSGSVIVFSDEMSDHAPRLQQALGATNPLSHERLRSIVEARHPDKVASTILNHIWEGRATTVFMQTKAYLLESRPLTVEEQRKRLNVYIDPYNGEILKEETSRNYDDNHPILNFLIDLHFYLLGGDTGGKVNSVLAMVLAVMCLTGMVIWWPGKRNWRRSLKVKWSAKWKRVNWDLHSAVGFWTLTLVLMWSISGVYYGFPQQFQSALATVLPFRPEIERKKSGWEPGDPVAPLDGFVEKAQQMFPGQKVQVFLIPIQRPNVDYVYVALSNEPETYPRKDNLVYFHPTSGEVLRIDRYSEKRLGDKVVIWLDSLHRGNFGGHFGGYGFIVVKAVWVILGLAPAVLFITGFLMWWNRVVSRKLKKWRSDPGLSTA